MVAAFVNIQSFFVSRLQSGQPIEPEDLVFLVLSTVIGIAFASLGSNVVGSIGPINQRGAQAILAGQDEVIGSVVGMIAAEGRIVQRLGSPSEEDVRDGARESRKRDDD